MKGKQKMCNTHGEVNHDKSLFGLKLLERAKRGVVPYLRAFSVT